jgi:hypothetical protein
LKEDYRYCNLTPYIGDYCPWRREELI